MYIKSVIVIFKNPITNKDSFSVPASIKLIIKHNLVAFLHVSHA